MKLQAHNTGKSYRCLTGGLELILVPYKQGWQLTLRRENAGGDASETTPSTGPSKLEYKIITKAFFDGRVKHLNKPDDNSLEIRTQ